MIQISDVAKANKYSTNSGVQNIWNSSTTTMKLRAVASSINSIAFAARNGRSCRCRTRLCRQTVDFSSSSSPIVLSSLGATVMNTEFLSRICLEQNEVFPLPPRQ